MNVGSSVSAPFSIDIANERGTLRRDRSPQGTSDLMDGAIAPLFLLQVIPMPDPSIQQQMEIKLAEWQKRLRLQDWDIKVDVVSLLGIECRNAYGQVRWDLNQRCADIKLLNPEDVEQIGGMRTPLIEETLIHELLHLLIAPFDNTTSDPEQQSLELCVNSIAAALYKLAYPADQKEIVVQPIEITSNAEDLKNIVLKSVEEQMIKTIKSARSPKKK